MSYCHVNVLQQNDALYVSHSHLIQLHQLKGKQNKSFTLRTSTLKKTKIESTFCLDLTVDTRSRQNVQESTFSTFEGFAWVSSCITSIGEDVLCHRALLLICRSLKIFIASQISRKSATGWTRNQNRYKSRKTECRATSWDSAGKFGLVIYVLIRAERNVPWNTILDSAISDDVAESCSGWEGKADRKRVFLCRNVLCCAVFSTCLGSYPRAAGWDDTGLKSHVVHINPPKSERRLLFDTFYSAEISRWILHQSL